MKAPPCVLVVFGQLAARFAPTLGWQESGRFMKAQVVDSANKVTTSLYDSLQKLQNKIES
jgi:hypothetical protein